MSRCWILGVTSCLLRCSNIFWQLLNAIFVNMEANITMVLEESDDISKEFLYPLLDSVRKEDKNVGFLSWQSGEQVLTNCADKVKPYLMEAVQSLGSVLDDYAPTVASIHKERSGVNLVEATPTDYSTWESMMKLLQDMNTKFNSPTCSENKCLTPQILLLAISLDMCSNFQDQKAIINELEPTQLEVCSSHEPVPDIETSNIGIEVDTTIDNLCIHNVVSWDFQDKVEELVVVLVDLASITDNLGVEEIVVQKSQTEEIHLADSLTYPSNLLEVQIIDFLGINNFGFKCDLIWSSSLTNCGL